MKINRLDEFFRSKLKNYKAEVPPHIWAQIKTELMENGTSSTRTAFPRVYILAASLVAVIAVASVITLPYLSNQNFSLEDEVAFDNQNLYLGQSPIIDTYKDEVISTKGSISLVKDKNEFIGSNLKKPSTLHSSNSFSSLTEEFIAEGVALDPNNTNLFTEPKTNTFSSSKSIKFEQESSSENSEDFKALDYLPIRSARKFGLARQNDNLKCAVFKEKRSRFFWGIAFAPNFVNRKFSVSNSDEFTGYINDRKRTESFESTFSINLDIGYEFQKHISIRSGLFYSRMSGNFQDSSIVSTDIVITTVYDSNGQIESSDTSFNHTYESINSNILMERLDIPLIVSYRKDFGRLNMDLSLGALFNVTYFTSGSILNPQGNTINISNKTDNLERIYKRNLGVSMYLGLGVYYELSQNIQFKLEPYIMYQPNSLTLSNYPLRESYTQCGLQLGMRYFL